MSSLKWLSKGVSSSYYIVLSMLTETEYEM
jgi:hypothetical protein